MLNKNIIPSSEIATIKTEEGGRTLVVLKDGKAYVNQTELAQWCETDKGTISGLANNVPKELKTLLGNDFLGWINVENPNNPEPWKCFDASSAYSILIYYAHYARGHSKRKKAKQLALVIGSAGAVAFIHNQVGYTLKIIEKPSSEEIQAPITQEKQITSRNLFEQALNQAERMQALFPHLGGMPVDFKYEVRDNLINMHRSLTGTQPSFHEQGLPQQQEHRPYLMGCCSYARNALGRTVKSEGTHAQNALGKWIRFFEPNLAVGKGYEKVNGYDAQVWQYDVNNPNVREKLTDLTNRFFEHPNPVQFLIDNGAYKQR